MGLQPLALDDAADLRAHHLRRVGQGVQQPQRTLLQRRGGRHAGRRQRRPEGGGLSRVGEEGLLRTEREGAQERQLDLLARHAPLAQSVSEGAEEGRRKPHVACMWYACGMHVHVHVVCTWCVCGMRMECAWHAHGRSACAARACACACACRGGGGASSSVQSPCSICTVRKKKTTTPGTAGGSSVRPSSLAASRRATLRPRNSRALARTWRHE